MKKLTFTLLLGWLLLLSSNLNAQNREGLFNLKEGDWFEMKFENSNGNFNVNNYFYFTKLKKDTICFVIWLNINILV